MRNHAMFLASLVFVVTLATAGSAAAADARAPRPIPPSTLAHFANWLYTYNGRTITGNDSTWRALNVMEFSNRRDAAIVQKAVKTLPAADQRWLADAIQHLPVASYDFNPPLSFGEQARVVALLNTARQNVAPQSQDQAAKLYIDAITSQAPSVEDKPAFRRHLRTLDQAVDLLTRLEWFDGPHNQIGTCSENMLEVFVASRDQWFNRWGDWKHGSVTDRADGTFAIHLPRARR